MLKQSIMRRTLRHPAWAVLCAAIVLAATSLGAQREPDATTAIVGGTIIDGTGRRPLADATVVVTGRRIVAVGPRASTVFPPART
jgi:hypothetical protein